MPFIIDGHNLLWSVQKVNPDESPANEAQLCRIISRYLIKVKEQGHIVFDGKGPLDKSEFDNIPSLEVIFSGANHEADDIIEDKIMVDTAPKRLSIVSNDREIRDVAKKRKATCVKCENFWREVVNSLRRKKTPSEPPQKQTGLTEGETDLWLDFLGFDQ